MTLFGKYSCFGALAPLAVLTSDFLDTAALFSRLPLSLRFNFVEQQCSREHAILTLMPTGLAFHLNAGRAMQQHDAGGSFVDVLPAMAAGSDERFLDVRLANAESGHSRRELIFVAGVTNGCAHAPERS